MKLPYQVLVFLPSMSFPSHGTKKKCWAEEASILEDAPACLYKALLLPSYKAKVV